MVGTVLKEYVQFCDPLDTERAEAIVEIVSVTLEMGFSAFLGEDQ